VALFLCHFQPVKPGNGRKFRGIKNLKNLPFWFPTKRNAIWYFLFIFLFILSLDFWNWGESEPFVYGLPLWVYYLLFLTIFTSLFFYLFTKYQWREDK
jgi:hypothetical protein